MTMTVTTMAMTTTIATEKNKKKMIKKKIIVNIFFVLLILSAHLERFIVFLYEMVNDPGGSLVPAVLLFWYPD